MSEKRFVYKQNKVYDTLTDEFHSSNMVSVNVLNELNDENEQLRKQVGELQKIIDLTSYQLKVQDRILKEVGE